MGRRLLILLLGTLLAAESFADSQQSPPVLPDTTATQQHRSPAGAIITVSLVVAALAGAGYLFYRKQLRDRKHADSIIAAVERTWDSAAASYAHEQYRDAVRQLQSISGQWYAYEKYSARFKKDRHVNPDSIKAVIASCDFLEEMILPVKALSEFAEKLPADEFGLSKIGRRELGTATTYLRRSMDSIMTIHSNHRNALQYSFRPINRRLHSLDSLIDAAYAQQKTDFAAKTKFHYNRAVSTGDSTALRDFVEDCDYFHVDKEWCQRARIILDDTNATPQPAAPQKGKLTAKDSMQIAFAEAVQSKRIEVLEAYIGKYTSRRYRSSLKAARIDSARVVLKGLRQLIDHKMAFNRTYPRFGSSLGTDIPIAAKGLSHTTEGIFTAVWSSLAVDIEKLPAIRLPARLSLDYTQQPPLLLLDGICSPEYDFEKTTVNSYSSFRVTCLLPAMKLLQRLKTTTITRIKDEGAAEGKSADVIDYETKKIDAGTYVVRLVKPGDNSALLLYSRDQRASSQDTSQTIQFYDFFDLSTTNNGTRRFTVYAGSLPDIIPSIASDSLERTMGEEFFGE